MYIVRVRQVLVFLRFVPPSLLLMLTANGRTLASHIDETVVELYIRRSTTQRQRKQKKMQRGTNIESWVRRVRLALCECLVQADLAFHWFISVPLQKK